MTWGAGPPEGRAIHYDFKEVAEYVAAQVKKQGKGRVFFGVFYDPVAKMPWAKLSKDFGKPEWQAELTKPGPGQGRLHEAAPPAGPGLRRLAETAEGDLDSHASYAASHAGLQSALLVLLRAAPGRAPA